MLTVRNIRQGDGGTYSCKASNKAGSQERELFLKVFGERALTINQNTDGIWLRKQSDNFILMTEYLRLETRQRTRRARVVQLTERCSLTRGDVYVTAHKHHLAKVHYVIKMNIKQQTAGTGRRSMTSQA